MENICEFRNICKKNLSIKHCSWKRQKNLKKIVKQLEEF